jgi:hypothetical protein
MEQNQCGIVKSLVLLDPVDGMQRLKDTNKLRNGPLGMDK